LAIRQFQSLLDAITIVKRETLLRWHHRGFRVYWRWKSWRSGGRPHALTQEVAYRSAT